MTKKIARVSIRLRDQRCDHARNIRPRLRERPVSGQRTDLIVPKKVLDKIRIDEISAVDIPAQEGARMAIMKRGAPGDEPGNKGKGGGQDFSKGAALTTSEDGHAHLIRDKDFDGVAVNAGETSYQTSEGSESGHSHPWIRLEDGSLVIGESDGHTHTIAAIAAKRATQGEPDMSKSIEKQLEEALAEIEKMKGESATALAKAADDLSKARDDRIRAAMSSSERKRFDGLSDDDRKTFLAGNKKKRGEEMAKWSDSDPVIYKAENGTEYRASQSEIAEIVKSADADRKETRLAKAEAADAKIEKRISVEFPAFPNAAAAGALLKAAEGIEDETLRKDAETLLKTSNAAIASLAESAGVGGDGGESQFAKASDTFGVKVAEIRKRDDCSHQVAMSKAREENPDLFKAMNEVAEAA